MAKTTSGVAPGTCIHRGPAALPRQGESPPEQARNDGRAMTSKERRSARMTDGFSHGPRTLPGNIDETRIVGNLFEDREEALGFGEHLALEVAFHLQERIVYSQP